jgi:hypothetical protein
MDVSLPLNDRINLAKQLNLPLEQFNALVSHANHAYEVFKDLGPFYGQEHIKEPTFRITAQPVMLPKFAQEQLRTFGNDVLLLGSALKQLPETYKNQLGEGLDYRIPFTWRVDAILKDDGTIAINELEGVDGANALMMAEQLAYHLQSREDSTAAHVISAIRKICGITDVYSHCKIALLKVNNPHIVNARKFVEIVKKLSGGTIQIDVLLEEEIRNNSIQPKWDEYQAVLNEAAFSPQELLGMGVQDSQLVFSGSYIGLINKGVFALVFDPKLKEFWGRHLGLVVLDRLQKLMIPSRFVTSVEDIQQARKQRNVVKASWTGYETSIINRGKGVALPMGDVEQSTQERWEYLQELFSQGARVIVQDFVMPGKVHAYLRKKGTTLEAVDWYNRICIKYVCDGDPNKEPLPSVTMTALEATLGPNVIPAGRKCAFTAATFGN